MAKPARYIVCPICNIEFKAKRSTSKYCSKECQCKGRVDSVTLQCQHCNIEFVVPKSENHRKHCSKECHNKSMESTVTIECQQCGDSFNVKPSWAKTRKFCSVKCRHDSDIVQVSVDCLNCSKEFFVAKWRKDTATHCSKECKNEYWVNNVIKTKKFSRARLTGIKKQWKTPGFREKITKAAIESMQIKGKETGIERKIRTWLECNNIEHIAQHNVNNKFCVDFYLPKHNVIIEAFGDYFHANPVKYPDRNDLNDFQKKKGGQDRAKIAYLTKCGYSLYVFWEVDINNNLDELMKSINELSA